jgi:hypothetical protein
MSANGYLSSTAVLHKPSNRIEARIRINHARIAGKDPNVSPPSTDKPIKVELYGDCVAYISPSTSGEPLTLIQHVPPVRMYQAKAGDLARLNGKVAPPKEPNPVDMILEGLAAFEGYVNNLQASHAAQLNEYKKRIDFLYTSYSSILAGHEKEIADLQAKLNAAEAGVGAPSVPTAEDVLNSEIAVTKIAAQ